MAALRGPDADWTSAAIKDQLQIAGNEALRDMTMQERREYEQRLVDRRFNVSVLINRSWLGALGIFGMV